MRQQIANRDLAGGRHDVEVERVAGSPAAAARGRRVRLRDGDLVQAFEFRDEARDRVAQADLAFFHQHHDRHAGDRLRHRSEAEDSVLGHRPVCFEISHALRFEVRDLAATSDQRDRAGDVACVDVAAYDLGDPFQPIARKAHFLGLRRRHRASHRRQNQQRGG